MVKKEVKQKRECREIKQKLFPNPHPRCKTADRNRDIYAKKTPVNTEYDIETADGFLSMNFQNYLRDSIPEDYLTDPQIAEDSIRFCVLAWDISVLKSKVKFRKYVPAFKEKIISAPAFKDILSAFGENFDEMLDCLLGIWKEEYYGFHDFIWAWELEESIGGDCCCEDHEHDEECCGEEYLNAELSVKGCALTELNVDLFE